MGKCSYSADLHLLMLKFQKEYEPKLFFRYLDT